MTLKAAMPLSAPKMQRCCNSEAVAVCPPIPFQDAYSVRASAKIGEASKSRACVRPNGLKGLQPEESNQVEDPHTSDQASGISQSSERSPGLRTEEACQCRFRSRL